MGSPRSGGQSFLLSRKPRFAQCIHKRVEVKKFFAHAQTKVSLASGLGTFTCFYVLLRPVTSCYVVSSDLATRRERQLTTARAVKIPARNWVDYAVAF